MGAPVTSSDATRNITLACIVAGTLLLVVFVAWKMRRRVRCSCACWGLADPADAERRRVLAAAAVLYQAAANDPDFKLRLRPSPAWCPQPSPSSCYTSPTLAPPDPGSTLGSPASWRSRSPAGSYQGEVVPALAAAPPLRSRASPSGRPPLPPAPSRSPAQQLALPGASPASSQRQRRSPPQCRSVRELVRAWSGGSSGGGRQHPPPAATAAAAAAVAVADLEAQQLSSTQEARAFTWSQLGISPAATPAASRRVSENAGGPPWPPLPPSQQGEVHANPVFDWAAAGAALEGGTAAGSFSHSQVRRTASRSRLSRGVSFADPAGEGSVHGGREGGGHSRRGSLLAGGSLEQGSPAGGQMNSRPSEQSLLQLHRELGGIQE